MYETTTTVIGTLITAPNRRRLSDGTSVVSFRVAANERRFDRANDTWTDGDSLYVSVTCWRKLAANVHASFVVGDPIIVHGRLFTRHYDKDGKRQSVVEMEAGAVGPDLTRSTAAVSRTKRTDTAVDVPEPTSPPPFEPGAQIQDDDPWGSAPAESHDADDTATESVQAERGIVVEAGVGN